MTLPPEIADFIQQGVAAAAGSCNALHQPSMARVLGCRVNAERNRITLLLSQRGNQVFLHDAQESGQVAVVFCLPSTERALQIKGSTVQIKVPEADDRDLVRRHNAAFTAQITPKGYSAAFADCYHKVNEAADLVALCFTPAAVFEQTPGPQAGRLMDGT